MRIGLLVAASIVLATGTASAEQTKERGGYVGGSGWEIFGSLGLDTLDVEFPGASSESEAVGDVGAGVRFSLTENFWFAVQLDPYAYEDTSLGAAYDIAFTATSRTLQYIFMVMEVLRGDIT